MVDEVEKEKQVSNTGKISKRKTERVRKPAARQALPSTGIGFEGQLKMLRAYVNASESGAKPVPLDRLANVSQVSRYTASSCNRFFDASNFILREKNGYRPTEGLITYVKQLPWDEERAKMSMREMMEDSWYGKELHVLFGTNPTMTADDLVIAIGSLVGARPDQKVALETLVKFITYAGKVKVDLDTGKLSLAEETQYEEVSIGLQRDVKEAQQETVKMAGLSRKMTVNVNLTLDITSGEAEEHARKIKEILEALSKEQE